MATFIRFIVLAAAIQAALAGAELSGIWMGEAPGRNGEKQDVAFQFKMAKGALSGTMFGEEFDLALEDLKLEGAKVSFAVTNTNYYSGTRQTTLYTGTLSEKEMQLTRERKDGPATPPANDKQGGKQTVTLKRVTS